MLLQIEIADTLNNFASSVAEPFQLEPMPSFSFGQVFLAGQPWGMIAVSLILIAVFFSAWKAPRWVHLFGKMGLAIGVFCTLTEFFTLCRMEQFYGDISLPVLCGGMTCAFVPAIYGVVVYFISLIIRIIQTPRI